MLCKTVQPCLVDLNWFTGSHFPWKSELDVSSNSIYHRRSSRLEVFCKNVSLRISQNLQENTCVSFFFNKVAGLRSKETLYHRYFPMNSAKFLRTTFFIEHSWWLLLSPGSTITRWLQSLGRNPYLRSFRCLHRSSYMQDIL